MGDEEGTTTDTLMIPGNVKEVIVGDDEIKKETKAEKFCRRHKINPNLVMLKITLFVMYGGEIFFEF